MTREELQHYYENDPDFQLYVDKCSEAYNCSVDEVLGKKIVNNVGEFYQEKKKEAGK